MKTTSQEPLRGEKLAKAVINQILGHPDTWNQKSWHTACGTKHCFAGWAQVLGGGNPKEGDAQSDATKFLEISPYEAAVLFAGDATLPMLYSFARNYSKGRDSAGYDRDGYNRDGYNRDGYNRDGYNRAGYNRDGYNRAGYNRAGYDRAGYNRAGYDRAGYDRAGAKLEMTPFKV